MKLDDHVALVTGGGSGMGAAAGRALAAEGARVGLLGRTLEDLEAVASGIERSGGAAIPLQADISDEDQVIGAIERLTERWGRLDVLFANAGINGVWAPIEELDLSDWKKTIDINLTGTFTTLKHAAPHLKRRGGSVIVTSSVNGTRMFSNSGATAYAATKAGQVAMAKMLALEWASDRVRVNVICPGAVETDIEENTQRRDLEEAQEPVTYPAGKIPLTDGRPARAEQVADLVVFLASPASSHITGTELWIDGGQSLLQG